MMVFFFFSLKSGGPSVCAPFWLSTQHGSTSACAWVFFTLPSWNLFILQVQIQVKTFVSIQISLHLQRLSRFSVLAYTMHAVCVCLCVGRRGCVCYPYTHLLILRLQSALLTEETTLASCNCPGDSASAKVKKIKKASVSVSSFTQRYE